MTKKTSNLKKRSPESSLPNPDEPLPAHPINWYEICDDDMECWAKAGFIPSRRPPLKRDCDEILRDYARATSVAAKQRYFMELIAHGCIELRVMDRAVRRMIQDV